MNLNYLKLKLRKKNQRIRKRKTIINRRSRDKIIRITLKVGGLDSLMLNTSGNPKNEDIISLLKFIT